jgi:hypothetical protein
MLCESGRSIINSYPSPPSAELAAHDSGALVNLQNTHIQPPKILKNMHLSLKWPSVVSKMLLSKICSKFVLSIPDSVHHARFPRPGISNHACGASNGVLGNEPDMATTL